MSSVELIVIGILLEKPLNAYEVARLIDERSIGRILKISKPAVYKCCKRLNRDGHLKGRITRDGEMPEKTIYTVTPKGKKHFHKLMEHFSVSILPFYMEFNSFLWGIDKLEPEKALKLMQNLQSELLSMKEWVIAHERKEKAHLDFAPAAIVKQYKMVMATLVTWIGETISEFERR